MIKRAATDMNDPNSRVELAKFAEDWGLISTAKQEYANILAIAPTNQAALEGMKRYAQNDLNDARGFFDLAQYGLAMQKASEVLKEYSLYPDIVKEAQALVAKAQVEEQKVQKDKKQQAVALALRGDDYYNQGMSYFSSYVSTNIRESARVFSARDEAAKYFRQAITAWQYAIQLDPSLGEQTSYNLRFKIADANQKYVVMANRNPPRLPLRDLNRITRGQNVQGSK
jgi:tetratricopeptide (TPR) repeat protein